MPKFNYGKFFKGKKPRTNSNPLPKGLKKNPGGSAPDGYTFSDPDADRTKHGRDDGYSVLPDNFGSEK